MHRRDFLGGIGLLALFGPSVRAAVTDPLPPEGVEITYRALFGSSEIGWHKIRIREHDDRGHVEIEHESKLKVRILFAVAYSLDHRSTEVWEGFQLKSVRSETIESNERSVVEGDTSGQSFIIHNKTGKHEVPIHVATTDSFWVAAALKEPTVVNARTGETATPNVEKLPDGRWHLKADFEHGTVDAKLRFDGDFLDEAEVDSDGHLVRLVRV